MSAWYFGGTAFVLAIVVALAVWAFSTSLGTESCGIGTCSAEDTREQNTSVDWAARAGREDMVRLLLARGAKPALPDDEPWGYSCRLGKSPWAPTHCRNPGWLTGKLDRKPSLIAGSQALTPQSGK